MFRQEPSVSSTSITDNVTSNRWTKGTKTNPPIPLPNTSHAPRLPIRASAGTNLPHRISSSIDPGNTDPTNANLATSSEGPIVSIESLLDSLPAAFYTLLKAPLVRTNHELSLLLEATEQYECLSTLSKVTRIELFRRAHPLVVPRGETLTLDLTRTGEGNTYIVLTGCICECPTRLIPKIQVYHSNHHSRPSSSTRPSSSSPASSSILPSPAFDSHSAHPFHSLRRGYHRPSSRTVTRHDISRVPTSMTPIPNRPPSTDFPVSSMSSSSSSISSFSRLSQQRHHSSASTEHGHLVKQIPSSSSSSLSFSSIPEGSAPDVQFCLDLLTTCILSSRTQGQALGRSRLLGVTAKAIDLDKDPLDGDTTTTTTTTAATTTVATTVTTTRATGAPNTTTATSSALKTNTATTTHRNFPQQRQPGSTSSTTMSSSISSIGCGGIGDEVTLRQRILSALQLAATRDAQRMEHDMNSGNGLGSTQAHVQSHAVAMECTDLLLGAYAKEHSLVLVIPKELEKQLVALQEHCILADRARFLATVPCFAPLSYRERLRIAELVVEVEVPALTILNDAIGKGTGNVLHSIFLKDSVHSSSLSMSDADSDSHDDDDDDRPEGDERNDVEEINGGSRSSGQEDEWYKDTTKMSSRRRRRRNRKVTCDRSVEGTNIFIVKEGDVHVVSQVSRQYQSDVRQAAAEFDGHDSDITEEDLSDREEDHGGRNGNYNRHGGEKKTGSKEDVEDMQLLKSLGLRKDTGVEKPGNDSATEPTLGSMGSRELDPTSQTNHKSGLEDGECKPEGYSSDQGSGMLPRTKLQVDVDTPLSSTHSPSTSSHASVDGANQGACGLSPSRQGKITSSGGSQPGTPRSSSNHQRGLEPKVVDDGTGRSGEEGVSKENLVTLIKEHMRKKLTREKSRLRELAVVRRLGPGSINAPVPLPIHYPQHAQNYLQKVEQSMQKNENDLRSPNVKQTRGRSESVRGEEMITPRKKRIDEIVRLKVGSDKNWSRVLCTATRTVLYTFSFEGWLSLFERHPLFTKSVPRPTSTMSSHSQPTDISYLPSPRHLFTRPASFGPSEKTSISVTSHPSQSKTPTRLSSSFSSSSSASASSSTSSHPILTHNPLLTSQSASMPLMPRLPTSRCISARSSFILAYILSSLNTTYAALETPVERRTVDMLYTLDDLIINSGVPLVLRQPSLLIELGPKPASVDSLAISESQQPLSLGSSPPPSPSSSHHIPVRFSALSSLYSSAYSPSSSPSSSISPSTSSTSAFTSTTSSSPFPDVQLSAFSNLCRPHFDYTLSFSSAAASHTAFSSECSAAPSLYSSSFPPMVHSRNNPSYLTSNLISSSRLRPSFAILPRAVVPLCLGRPSTLLLHSPSLLLADNSIPSPLTTHDPLNSTASPSPSSSRPSLLSTLLGDPSLRPPLHHGVIQALSTALSLPSGSNPFSFAAFPTSVFSFFARFPLLARLELLSSCQFRLYQKGDVIFEQDSIFQRIVVVLSGVAATTCHVSLPTSSSLLALNRARGTVEETASLMVLCHLTEGDYAGDLQLLPVVPTQLSTSPRAWHTSPRSANPSSSKTSSSSPPSSATLSPRARMASVTADPVPHCVSLIAASPYLQTMEISVPSFIHAVNLHCPPDFTLPSWRLFVFFHSLPVFHNAPLDLLCQLVYAVDNVTCLDRHIILSAGNVPTGLYFIVSGSVNIVRSTLANEQSSKSAHSTSADPLSTPLLRGRALLTDLSSSEPQLTTASSAFTPVTGTDPRLTSGSSTTAHGHRALHLVTLREGEHFGEALLHKESLASPSPYSYIATSSTQIAFLPSSKLQALLRQSDIESLTATHRSRMQWLKERQASLGEVFEGALIIPKKTGPSIPDIGSSLLGGPAGALPLPPDTFTSGHVDPSGNLISLSLASPLFSSGHGLHSVTLSSLLPHILAYLNSVYNSGQSSILSLRGSQPPLQLPFAPSTLSAALSSVTTSLLQRGLITFPSIQDIITSNQSRAFHPDTSTTHIQHQHDPSKASSIQDPASSTITSSFLSGILSFVTNAASLLLSSANNEATLYPRNSVLSPSMTTSSAYHQPTKSGEVSSPYLMPLHSTSIVIPTHPESRPTLATVHPTNTLCEVKPMTSSNGLRGSQQKEREHVRRHSLSLDKPEKCNMRRRSSVDIGLMPSLARTSITYDNSTGLAGASSSSFPVSSSATAGENGLPTDPPCLPSIEGQGSVWGRAVAGELGSQRVNQDQSDGGCEGGGDDDGDGDGGDNDGGDDAIGESDDGDTMGDDDDGPVDEVFSAMDTMYPRPSEDVLDQRLNDESSSPTTLIAGPVLQFRTVRPPKQVFLDTVLQKALEHIHEGIERHVQSVTERAIETCQALVALEEEEKVYGSNGRGNLAPLAAMLGAGGLANVRRRLSLSSGPKSLESRMFISGNALSKGGVPSLHRTNSGLASVTESHSPKSVSTHDLSRHSSPTHSLRTVPASVSPHPPLVLSAASPAPHYGDETKGSYSSPHYPHAHISPSPRSGISYPITSILEATDDTSDPYTLSVPSPLRGPQERIRKKSRQYKSPFDMHLTYMLNVFPFAQNVSRVYPIAKGLHPESEGTYYFAVHGIVGRPIRPTKPVTQAGKIIPRVIKEEEIPREDRSGASDTESTLSSFASAEDDSDVADYDSSNDRPGITTHEAPPFMPLSRTHLMKYDIERRLALLTTKARLQLSYSTRAETEPSSPSRNHKLLLYSSSKVWLHTSSPTYLLESSIIHLSHPTHSAVPDSLCSSAQVVRRRVASLMIAKSMAGTNINKANISGTSAGNGNSSRAASYGRQHDTLEASDSSSSLSAHLLASQSGPNHRNSFVDISNKKEMKIAQLQQQIEAAHKRARTEVVTRVLEGIAPMPSFQERMQYEAAKLLPVLPTNTNQQAASDSIPDIEVRSDHPTNGANTILGVDSYPNLPAEKDSLIDVDIKLIEHLEQSLKENPHDVALRQFSGDRHRSLKTKTIRRQSAQNRRTQASLLTPVYSQLSALTRKLAADSAFRAGQSRSPLKPNQQQVQTQALVPLSHRIPGNGPVTNGSMSTQTRQKPPELKSDENDSKDTLVAPTYIPDSDMKQSLRKPATSRRMSLAMMSLALPPSTLMSPRRHQGGVSQPHDHTTGGAQSGSTSSTQPNDGSQSIQEEDEGALHREDTPFNQPILPSSPKRLDATTVLRHARASLSQAVQLHHSIAATSSVTTTRDQPDDESAPSLVQSSILEEGDVVPSSRRRTSVVPLINVANRRASMGPNPLLNLVVENAFHRQGSLRIPINHQNHMPSDIFIEGGKPANDLSIIPPSSSSLQSQHSHSTPLSREGLGDLKETTSLAHSPKHEIASATESRGGVLSPNRLVSAGQRSPPSSVPTGLTNPPPALDLSSAPRMSLLRVDSSPMNHPYHHQGVTLHAYRDPSHPSSVPPSASHGASTLSHPTSRIIDSPSEGDVEHLPAYRVFNVADDVPRERLFPSLLERAVLSRGIVSDDLDTDADRSLWNNDGVTIDHYHWKSTQGNQLDKLKSVGGKDSDNTNREGNMGGNTNQNLVVREEPVSNEDMVIERQRLMAIETKLGKQSQRASAMMPGKINETMYGSRPSIETGRPLAQMVSRAGVVMEQQVSSGIPEKFRRFIADDPVVIAARTGKSTSGAGVQSSTLSVNFPRGYREVVEHDNIGDGGVSQTNQDDKRLQKQGLITHQPLDAKSTKHSALREAMTSEEMHELEALLQQRERVQTRERLAELVRPVRRMGSAREIGRGPLQTTPLTSLSPPLGTSMSPSSRLNTSISSILPKGRSHSNVFTTPGSLTSEMIHSVVGSTRSPTEQQLAQLQASLPSTPSPLSSSSSSSSSSPSSLKSPSSTLTFHPNSADGTTTTGMTFLTDIDGESDIIHDGNTLQPNPPTSREPRKPLNSSPLDSNEANDLDDPLLPFEPATLLLRVDRLCRLSSLPPTHLAATFRRLFSDATYSASLLRRILHKVALSVAANEHERLLTEKTAGDYPDGSLSLVVARGDISGSGWVTPDPMSPARNGSKDCVKKPLSTVVDKGISGRVILTTAQAKAIEVVLGEARSDSTLNDANHKSPVVDPSILANLTSKRAEILMAKVSTPNAQDDNGMQSQLGGGGGGGNDDLSKTLTHPRDNPNDKNGVAQELNGNRDTDAQRSFDDNEDPRNRESFSFSTARLLSVFSTHSSDSVFAEVLLANPTLARARLLCDAVATRLIDANEPFAIVRISTPYLGKIEAFKTLMEYSQMDQTWETMETKTSRMSGRDQALTQSQPRQQGKRCDNDDDDDDDITQSQLTLVSANELKKRKYHWVSPILKYQAIKSHAPGSFAIQRDHPLVNAHTGDFTARPISDGAPPRPSPSLPLANPWPLRTITTSMPYPTSRSSTPRLGSARPSTTRINTSRGHVTDRSTAHLSQDGPQLALSLETLPSHPVSEAFNSTDPVYVSQAITARLTGQWRQLRSQMNLLARAKAAQQEQVDALLASSTSNSRLPPHSLTHDQDKEGDGSRYKQVSSPSALPSFMRPTKAATSALLASANYALTMQSDRSEKSRLTDSEHELTIYQGQVEKLSRESWEHPRRPLHEQNQPEIFLPAIGGGTPNIVPRRQVSVPIKAVNLNIQPPKPQRRLARALGLTDNTYY